jgi:hypothetical protein
MRPILLTVMLALAAGALAAGTPEDGAEAVIDAVYASDASALMEELSETSLEQLEAVVMMVKMSPDEAAGQMSAELGREISSEELMQWTAVDMLDAFLSSPMLEQALPPREVVRVARCEADGDTAVVYLSVPEVEEEMPLLMVLEGEDWKLGEGFMGTQG